MSMTPLELYHGVLESLDYQADSQGAIHYHFDGETKPEKIDGLQLVLPTPEILRVISTDNTMIPFHPLSENITMGESKVLRRIKLWVINKLTTMMSFLGVSLLEIASEKGPLTAETTELGKTLANATPKTLEHFLNVINTIDQQSKQFVSIYIKRKGKLPDREQPYRRVAVVRFPIMEEFQEGKPDNMIFDIKMSKKDKVTIGEMLKFMLKGIAIDGAYSVGTDSSSAPNFVALMQAYAKIAMELSSHATAMKSKINEPVLLPKLNWLPLLDDLTVFTGVIPPLRDNEGESETQNVNMAIQSAAPAPVAVAPSTMAVNGVPMMQQPTVGKYATTNSIQTQPIVQQQPTYPVQGMQYGQPVMPTPQPGMPVQIPGYYPMQQMQAQVPQQQADFGAMVTQQAFMNQAQQMGMPMQPQMPQQMPYGALPQMGIPPMMSGMMPGMPMMLPNGVPMQMPMQQMQPQMPMPMSFAPGGGAGKYTTA